MNGVTLIDTDILIDVGRGVAKAVNWLDDFRAQASPALSVVSQMELIVGCQNKSELQKLTKFLRPFQIINVNDAISEKAVELLRRFRLSHGLLIADSLIAATALVHDTPLISKNQADYRFIKGLNLLPYP